MRALRRGLGALIVCACTGARHAPRTGCASAFLLTASPTRVARVRAQPCFMLFDTRGTQGALDEYAEQLVQVVDGTLPPGSLMWREGDNEDDDAGFADVFSSGLDFGGGDAGTPAGATGASAAPLDASARVRRGDFLQVDCCVIVADALSADVHGERARFVSGSMAFVQRLRGIGMFPLLVLTHAREAGEPAGDENAAGRGSRLARARRNMVRLYDPWRDELRMSSEQLESAVYCVDNALRHASDAEWATRLAGARDAVVDLLLDCARAAADFREHVRECASRDAAQRPR